MFFYSYIESISPKVSECGDCEVLLSPRFEAARLLLVQARIIKRRRW